MQPTRIMSGPPTRIRMWNYRVASDFCNKNSRTIQEHFKNTSIIFKNISNVENIISIGLRLFLKKPNTKDKCHEIQISTRTKVRKS